MSVEAMAWALNLAPVPRDRAGKRNPSCKAVLVGLANHAAPDGREAFPSVRTLVRYTDLSERTVRTALDRLGAEGIIQPCDPAVVAAKIKRADQRPQGWDLAMHLVRDDLDDEELAALERQFPGLTARVAAMRTAGGPRSDHAASGVQPLHPAADTPVDNVTDGVQPLHPVPPTGCNHRRNGVQRLQERGAAVAPEPSFEPSREPSAACAGARDDPGPVDNRLGPGGGASEFFNRLGPGWPLTSQQRRRLAPMAAAAIEAGWSPAALAAFAGANTTGVRSPYAVLAVRLSPAELPAPPSQARPRPPWCGQCDERTRHLQHADAAGRPGRCPRCHPLATGNTQKTGRTPAEARSGGRPSQTAVSRTPTPVRAPQRSPGPRAQLPSARDAAFVPPAGSWLCAAGRASGWRCGPGGRPGGRGPGQTGVSVARNRSGSRCSQRSWCSGRGWAGGWRRWSTPRTPAGRTGRCC